MEKLKKRWGLKSNLQVILVLLVFSITGSAASLLSNPVTHWLGIDRETMSLWLYWPLRIFVLFPIYQILLVIIGALFGQFTFFWNFEKKMLKRLGLGFLLKD